MVAFSYHIAVKPLALPLHGDLLLFINVNKWSGKDAIYIGDKHARKEFCGRGRI